MVGKIKNWLRKIVLGEKHSSQAYVNYLRAKGMQIGEDVKFYSPSTTIVDEQYPWMITIGDHVRITHGVALLTHDYSWSVLKRFDPPRGQEGAVLGASGHISIGNNVFIGTNTVVMRNVTIGSNVIIGAGSVVTGDCEDNGVYAGNPAKKVMDLDRFYQKREQAQLQEAVRLANGYYDRFGEKPGEDVFHEYFMLFSDVEQAERSAVFSEKMKKCDNGQQSAAYLRQNPPRFKDYDAFWEYCIENK